MNGNEEGVDFIPSNIELSGLEVSLVNVLSREMIIRNYISRIQDIAHYDYVILDCMLIMLGIAAGLVIIPEPVTMFLTEGILSIKDFIGSLAEG